LHRRHQRQCTCRSGKIIAYVNGDAEEVVRGTADGNARLISAVQDLMGFTAQIDPASENFHEQTSAWQIAPLEQLHDQRKFSRRFNAGLSANSVIATASARWNRFHNGAFSSIDRAPGIPLALPAWENVASFLRGCRGQR
jgi:hypothetical protein